MLFKRLKSLSPFCNSVLQWFSGIVIDRETEVETIVKRDIKIEGEVDLDHETI